MCILWYVDENLYDCRSGKFRRDVGNAVETSDPNVDVRRTVVLGDDAENVVEASNIIA